MSIKFSKEHEWINAANPEAAVVGITVHAQDALGDVVFVDLPAVGATFNQGEVADVVESVKAASDVYWPLDGIIVEVNELLADNPELINQDPYGEGWIFVLEIEEPDQLNELLAPDDYAELLEDEDH